VFELYRMLRARRWPGAFAGRLVVDRQPGFGQVRGEVIVTHAVRPLAETMRMEPPGVNLAVDERQADPRSATDFFDREHLLHAERTALRVPLARMYARVRR
jgi:hypothetical protein